MYYPKSQIKTNLYTNGKDFLNSSTKEEYIGYYYETSTGNTYSGKTPEDGPNILLQPSPTLSDTLSSNISSNPLIVINDVIDDQYLSPQPSIIRSIPQFNITLPTDQDKQNGQFNRYFCKKTNELKYLEISQDTYQQLKNRDPKIAWDLYTPAIVLWVIQGDQTQVFNSNKATVQALEQNLPWYGFTQYFQDKFLKYYLGS
jgi:hypothetical protein